MISIAAIALIAVAYWAYVTKPVKDEMQKEKHLQDSEAADRIARSTAEQNDYDTLFNTEGNF